MKQSLRAEGHDVIGGMESRESDGLCIFDNQIIAEGDLLT